MTCDPRDPHVLTHSFPTRPSSYLSYEETKYGLKAGYRLDDGTRFTAVAQRREIRRSFSERRETDENTFTVTASRGFGEAFDGSVRYTRADRTGSPYDGTVPLQFGFVEGFLEEEPGGFEAPPALRRLNLASRQRDQLGANLTYTPLTWLALRSEEHTSELPSQ